MDINEIFTQALPLPEPWKVTSSSLEGKTGVLNLRIEVPMGSRLSCPKCEKEECGVHDRIEKSWRHLNFWQYETFIHAKVPRVKCSECGVHQVNVPWAREGSGFTLLFEALVLTLCEEMPVATCAQKIGEHDNRLWRVLQYYVNKAHAAKDWSHVKKITVDETSRKKGHNYVTSFVDTDTSELLFMTEGKDADTFDKFAAQLANHQCEKSSITEVAMDMSPAFRSGAKKHFPDARIVYDRFHVMQMVGKAADQVRKDLNREVGGLGKGAMWALRGNERNLKPRLKEQRKQLCKDHSIIGRAMGLRDYFQDLWNYANEELALEHFESWFSWARRCRLEPFKDLALRLRKHLDGILAYYQNYTTSAMIESMNGKLQLAKRRARGYRNVENFKVISYWMLGGIRSGLNLQNPLSMPTF